MKNTLMPRLPEFEQLFDNFLVPSVFQHPTFNTQTLKADYFVENNQLYLNVDVPGSSPEDVTVEYNKQAHSILVKVSKQYEKKDNKPSFYRRERCLSEQSRSFSLPNDVDESTIQADIKNGLLNITAKFFEKLPETNYVTIKVNNEKTLN